VTVEQEQHWEIHIEELLQTVAHDYVLDTDEMLRLLWLREFLTWTEVNCDHPRVFDPRRRERKKERKT
jgi:hypothetical protein